jgi:hypothetical protein
LLVDLVVVVVVARDGVYHISGRHILRIYRIFRIRMGFVPRRPCPGRERTHELRLRGTGDTGGHPTAPAGPM